VLRSLARNGSSVLLAGDRLDPILWGPEEEFVIYTASPSRRRFAILLPTIMAMLTLSASVAQAADLASASPDVT
jgi:hypothetical protein